MKRGGVGVIVNTKVLSSTIKLCPAGLSRVDRYLGGRPSGEKSHFSYSNFYNSLINLLQAMICYILKDK